MQKSRFLPLTRAAFYSKLLSMKANNSSLSRSRSDILADIVAIPHAVQGKVCSMKKTLANGSVATYYNLQWWADGKNHSIHIPSNKVQQFQKAVGEGERLRQLVAELSVSDTWDETPYFGIFKATWTVTAAGQTETISQVIFLLPLPVIVIALLLLTIIIVWITIVVRKRKERRSKFAV